MSILIGTVMLAVLIFCTFYCLERWIKIDQAHKPEHRRIYHDCGNW